MPSTTDRLNLSVDDLRNGLSRLVQLINDQERENPAVAEELAHHLVVLRPAINELHATLDGLRKAELRAELTGTMPDGEPVWQDADGTWRDESGNALLDAELDALIAETVELAKGPVPEPADCDHGHEAANEYHTTNCDWPQPEAAPQPVVLVIRDPDAADDIHLFGVEAEVVYLDLGSSFDIGHGLAAYEVDEAREWIDWQREGIASLAADHPARTMVEEVLARVQEAIDQATT